MSGISLKSLTAFALLVAMLVSLVPAAFAAPDNQAVQTSTGSISITCTYDQYFLKKNSLQQQDDTAERSLTKSNQTGSITNNIKNLQEVFNILATGKYVSAWRDVWGDSSLYGADEYDIDMDAPVKIELQNNKNEQFASIVNVFDKKVIFTKDKQEAGIATADTEEVITIYNGSAEGVTISSFSGASTHPILDNQPANNKIIFSKGLEVNNGAVVNFQTREITSAQNKVTSHRLTIEIGDSTNSSAELNVNGGTLNISGIHFYPGTNYAETYTWLSSAYLVLNNGASVNIGENGAVTLTGTQVENANIKVGNSGALTVKDADDAIDKAFSNLTTTGNDPAVKCEAGSSLTLSGSSTVTSKGDKAVDLEKGAKVTIGDSEEHTVGEVADAFVDNSGFLVEKENEGDLIPKVDATEVEHPKFNDSIEQEVQEALGNAVGGITAELPTEEQEAAAKEYAHEPDEVKADFGNDVEVDGKEIYVHVLTTVETTVTDYNKDAGILTLDITPYYQVIATTAADKSDIHLTTEGGKQKNAVELKEKTELQVTAPVSMTIPLPDGFSNISDVMIIHEHDGKTDRYTGNVSGGKVTFTTDGFSTFKLVALKNGTLKDLTSSAGSMEPFDPGKTDKTYTVSVPYSVTELTLTATKVNSYGTVTAAREDGEAPTVADAGSNNFTVSVPDLEVGENTVIITVTHESTETTYTVTIVRAAYVPPVPPSYMVTVEADENATVETSATGVRAGDSVTVTVTPAENFHVSGVTVTGTDGKEITVVDNGDGTFTFTMPSGGVTVKAETFKCPSVEYTDIDVTEWYHDYVDYAITHDLMDGFGDGVFAPEKTVTRAQMAGILWNLEGQPVVNYLMTFTDVPDGKWYTEAIRWAASEGIISGYGDNTFKPEDIITREQMAAMLYFYEEYKNGDHAVDAELTFTDSGEVSSWANEAVVWCVGKDLIHGKGDNAFDPRGTSIRAQLATLLALYDQMDK